MHSSARGLPLDRSNLVWRAAEALWQSAGRRGSARDVSVILEKMIPVAGGLGGGSSDAAATLVALSRLWGIGGRRDVLLKVARELGADVPFFLTGGSALGLGRGDEVTPLGDPPRAFVVLLVPGFRVSTADAYRWYDEDRSVGQVVPSPCPDPTARASTSQLDRVINDLEGPVARRHPEIPVMKAALERCGARSAAMAGSGSSVFGLFSERDLAVAAAKELSDSRWKTLLSRTISRACYRRRAAPWAASLPQNPSIG